MFNHRVPARGPKVRVFLFAFVVLLLLAPTLSYGQATIKVNDNVNVRFGLLLQGWADAQEAIDAQGNSSYAKNLFIRRIRFLVGGQIAPNVSFFFETDNPNDGKAPKALGSGFITQDAFLEWKPRSNAFILDAGLMLPPLCRNCLESAATILSLDYGSYSFLESAPTQSVVGRDTGFLGKGYLDNGHFEYRLGVFQGVRNTGSRNSFRQTGRIMYNVWDTETGYTYPGVYLGNKRILSFGGGADHQQDYKAFSVDAFLSVPMGGGGGMTTTGTTGAPTTTPPAAAATPHNALNAELTLLSFDGGSTFATALPEQKAVTLQAGYYLAGPKVMPWARLERQDFKARSNNGRDNNRAQLGATWFPAGHNFNVKGAYSRVKPRSSDATNEFTIQMQFFYY